MYSSGKPDAIICYLSERELLGEPLDKKIVERYKISDSLKKFPLDMNKVKIPKILVMSDFWHSTKREWRKVILKNDFAGIFSTMCPPFCDKKIFDQYFDPDIQSYFHPLSTAINSETFRDYGFPKEHDVMLFGRLGDFFYPLRTHFDRVLREQANIKYFNKGNPPYKFYENDEVAGDIPIRKNYARSINQSRIFLTCCTRYKVPLAKLFEVMACKSLLMCDRPAGAELLGLVNGETFIEVNKENFLEKIRYYLKREDELGRITANGYNLVFKRHTTDKRAAEFMEIVGKIVEQGCNARIAKKPSYGFLNSLRDLRDKCFKQVFALTRTSSHLFIFGIRAVKDIKNRFLRNKGKR